MARKRQIDPEVWRSEQFVALSLPARLLWIGLISQADDEGRLKGGPLWLKMAIFPADSTPLAQIEQWLAEVLVAGLARRYEADGQSYLHLPTFSKYQYISKPYPSKLPPPPTELGLEGESPAPPGAGMVQERSGNGSGMRNEVGVEVGNKDEKRPLPPPDAASCPQDRSPVPIPDGLRLFLSGKDAPLRLGVYGHARRVIQKHGEQDIGLVAVRHAFVEADSQLQRGEWRPRNAVGWLVKLMDKHVRIIRAERARGA